MKRPKVVVAILAALGLGCIATGIGVVLVVQHALGPTHRTTLEVTAICDATTAQDTERDVAVPLETALLAMPGVAHVRTRSSAGLVVATIEPSGDVAMPALRSATRSTLEHLTLPGSAFAQLSADIDPVPVRRLTVSGEPDARAPLAARTAAALHAVAGVAWLRTCGEDRAVVRVVVDEARLAQYDLGIADVRHVLEDGEETPLGRVQAGQPVRAGTTTDASTAALLARVVATHGDTVVRLADVARVESTRAPGRCRAWQQGTGEVVAIDVLAMPGADRDELRRRVDAAIGSLGAPPGAVSVLPDEDHVATGFAITAATLEQERWPLVQRLADGLSSTHSPVDVVVRTQSPDPNAPANALDVVVAGHAQAPPTISSIAIPAIVLETDAPGRTVRVAGSDLERLRTTAVAVRDAISASGVPAERLDPGDGPHLDITPEAATVARYGIAQAELDTTLTLVRTGAVHVATMTADGETKDVELVLGNAPRVTTEIGRVGLRTATGARVPLDQVARIELRAVPVQIVRVDGTRVVEVRATGSRRAIDDAIHGLAATVTLPVGVRLETPP